MPEITTDPGGLRPSGHGPAEPMPWWWFVLFLIIFLVFAAVVVVLVAQGQSLKVAVGVPATLSTAALVVLHRLAALARRRHG